MKTLPLEPGLLRLFRFFLVVQLLLVLGNVLAHSQRGMLAGCPWCALAFGVGNVCLLFGYLAWPALHRRLGRFYLPLALVYMAVFSLVLQDLFLRVRASGADISSEETAWQLFLFLFIPLILIAWQYHFKAVIAYCLFTALLDHALMTWTYPDFLAASDTYNRLLFIRTLAFLITGYVIAQIMSQFRAQRAALEQANRELGHYASTLEHLTISRERNRMARELHDTLAHTLSGIAVQLEAIQSLWEVSPDEARAMLTRCLELTRSGLGETRRALHDLRAGPLEDLGLELALRHLAQETAERGGLQLDWRPAGPLPGLSPDVEQGLYRMAQEVCENILRHAAARRITFEWRVQAGRLVLSIGDDGQGFSPAASEAGQHFGLRGLRERAGLLGGRLQIVSQPGQGSTISMEVQV